MKEEPGPIKTGVSNFYIFDHYSKCYKVWDISLAEAIVLTIEL